MKEIKINTVKIEIDVNKLIGSPLELINAISGDYSKEFLEGYNAYITRNDKAESSILIGEYGKGYEAARALFNAGEIFAIKKRGDYSYIVKVLKDGNAYCCIGTEFRDLQSSDDYAFGYSIYKAISNYAKIKQAQLNLKNTIAEVDKSNSVNEVKEPELKEFSPEELKNISVKITNAAPEEVIKIFNNDSLVKENKELLQKLELANSQIDLLVNIVNANEFENKEKSNKLNELNLKLIELFTENKELTNSIYGAQNRINQLSEENKQLKNDYVSVCQSNEEKTLALEEFKAKVESSKIELYANASLPKLPDVIMEELVKMYLVRNNGDNLGGWLLYCAKEANKIKPIHPIDGDNLQYLKHCFEAHSKSANYTYNSLPAYLKQACAEFGKLEKIKAIL